MELRQELAKLGYTRKEQTGPSASAYVRPDFRQHRPTRLSSVQRLTQIMNDVRRWLGLDASEVVEEKTAPAETKTMAETKTVAEKISPAIKATEKIQPEPPPKLRPQIKSTVPAPSQSRGIRM